MESGKKFLIPVYKQLTFISKILKSNTIISYDWSYFMAWAGTLTCLIAAILFAGGAVCLRGEREKEENLNLQYLMPGTYC